MFEAAERGGSSLDPSPWRLVVAGSSGRSLGVMNENILASVQCLVSRDIKIAQRYTTSSTTTAHTVRALQSPCSLHIVSLQ